MIGVVGDVLAQPLDIAINAGPHGAVFTEPDTRPYRGSRVVGDASACKPGVRALDVYKDFTFHSASCCLDFQAANRDWLSDADRIGGYIGPACRRLRVGDRRVKLPTFAYDNDFLIVQASRTEPINCKFVRRVDVDNSVRIRG